MTALGMTVVDLLIVSFVIVTIYYDIEERSSKSRLICVCIAGSFVIGYAIRFGMEFNAWKNANTALYRTLYPGFTALTGLVILILFSVFSRLFFRKRHEGRLFDKSVLVGLFVSLMILMTVFLSPFFETYLTNRTEFSFSFSGLFLPLIIYCVIIVLVILALFMLLNKKSGIFLISGLWSFGVMSYIQGLFMNGSLFIMDGKEMDWSVGLVFGNLAIWIVGCIGLTILINHRVLKKHVDKVLMYSAAFFFVIQLVGIISLVPRMTDSSEADKSVAHDFLSEEGINEVASENNVVVFVLDTFDVDFYEEVEKTDSGFFEPLSDFVFFPDTVSQYSRTYPSVPYMLSHVPYNFEQPKKDYVDSAFSECSFWPELQNAGYDVYVFEDDNQCIGETLLTSSRNYCEEGHVISETDSFWGAVKAIAQMGAYKQLPYLAKSSLAYTAESINKTVIKEKIWDNKPYSIDDAGMIASMKNEGLTLSNDSKAFRFIHMMGAHAPYILDSTGKEIKDRVVSPVEQYKGCMQYVYLYLDEMKRLGVYDSSTIIITADHGKNFVAEELPEKTNPILLVKKPNSSITGTEETGPLISEKQASLEDILPTIAGILGLKYKGVGVDLNSDSDDVRLRYHNFAVVKDTHQIGTLKYQIIDNSGDFSNWENTGEFSPFGEYYE